jgi:hypothetical protein
VKADGTKSNRLAEFSDDVGNRRETERQKIGSLWLTQWHLQPREPVGEKNGITNMAHKRASYVRVGAAGSLRIMGEKLCVGRRHALEDEGAEVTE